MVPAAVAIAAATAAATPTNACLACHEWVLHLAIWPPPRSVPLVRVVRPFRQLAQPHARTLRTRLDLVHIPSTIAARATRCITDTAHPSPRAIPAASTARSADGMLRISYITYVMR